jgi:hypothetical protein
MHAYLLKKKAYIMINDSDKMNKLESENKSLKEKGRQAEHNLTLAKFM